MEFEYTRKGALSYLSAWDVRRAKLFGRCEAKTGIIPFTRLFQDLMACGPYCSARGVFWILDNGSSPCGLPSIRRFQGKWPQMVVVNLPVQASWLNQIEIDFSILQRKVLTPNDFLSLVHLTERVSPASGTLRKYRQAVRVEVYPKGPVPTVAETLKPISGVDSCGIIHHRTFEIEY